VTRFRPTRYGVIGLYQYADQVFQAEGGRLALRGRNTSGKSKVLEVVMPFVLEGDISPLKLDPFSRGKSKTMHWNLIGCTDKWPSERRNKAVGYVWAEFHHAERDEHVTCGIGLQASRDSTEIKRWYFVTDQRIGSNLILCEPDGDELAPLARKPSIERITAGGGHVFDSQEDYKRAIRERLIGFENGELYNHMLKLIRQLRQPKLSKGIESETISKMLSETLPTVDEQQMRGLGDALDRLDQLGRELRGLRDGRALAQTLATKTFRQYARAAVGARAGALRAAERTFETASRVVGERDADRDAAEREQGEARAALDDARSALRSTQAQREALMQSETYKTVAELERVREAVDEGSGAHARAEAHTAEARKRLGLASAEHDDAKSREVAAQRDVARIGDELQGALRQAGLEAHVDAHAMLEGVIHERRERVAEQRRLAAVTEAVAERQRDRAEGVAAAAALVAERCEERDAATRVRDEAAESLSTAVTAWRTRLVELVSEAAPARALAEMAATDPPRCRETLQALWRDAHDRLGAQDGALQAAASRLDEEVAVREVREADLLAQRDVPPEARFPDRGPREGRAGAALWQLVDFADDIAESERGPLEAALQASGILDAWVDVDGTVAEQDMTLVSAEAAAASGPALSAFLVPACGDTSVGRELVARVLAAVPTDGIVSLGPGRFRAGPLRGRAVKPVAQFIGLQARRAHRAAQLAQVREQLGELGERLDETQRQRADVQRRRVVAAEERDAFPPGEELREAEERVRASVSRLADAEGAAAKARTAREEADVALRHARRAATEHAAKHGLPVVEELLGQLVDALDKSERLLGRLTTVETVLALHVRATAKAAEGLVDRQEAVAGAESRQAEAKASLDREQGRLRAVEVLLGDIDASEILKHAESLRADAKRLEKENDEAGEALVTASSAFTLADTLLTEAKNARDEAETSRLAAVGGVQALARARMFTAISGDEPLAADEAAADGWTLTTALDRIRGLPPELAVEPNADQLEALVNQVVRTVTDLNHQLALHDMEVTPRTQDGLMVCDVVRHGRVRALHELIAELDVDVARHELLLSEERSRALGEAVRTEIAEHLRQRIVGVRTTLATRNRALRKCATGGGKRLELSWVLSDLEANDAEAVVLLGDRFIDTMGDLDREKVFAFVERCAQRASENIEGEADAERRRGGVMAAFDYRNWFRFELEVLELDGSRERLTAQKHGEGSGGEQSVLLNVALFASAAAMYDLVPEAPRLVALDEAMDGIDEQVRHDVLAALVDLDLDFIATSFDLDPCVPAVPAVGFYELHRDNDEWGVFAQHFVWNGRERIEVVDEDEGQQAA
jgi:uncharacterized protein (TIGR02680 family)